MGLNELNNLVRLSHKIFHLSASIHLKGLNKQRYFDKLDVFITFPLGPLWSNDHNRFKEIFHPPAREIQGVRNTEGMWAGEGV
jgi:hypothetical protein